MNDIFQEKHTAPAVRPFVTVYDRKRIFDKREATLLSVMQKAIDLDDRRIYDRILEVCVPILFDGENFRRGNAAENLKKAARLLNKSEPTEH